ncbi:MAG: hypothetical protein QOF57_2049 [Frankiaceae bacterium]|jgi:hypothetical protein|nr:hypothetical protein [Frankiaceae bacterium]
MRNFRRTNSGITGRLSAPEVAVLKTVIDEVLGILTPPDDGAAPDPLAVLTGLDLPPAPDTSAHPVLARLFPDAYRDDPAASEAFRVLAHGELAAAKREALETMRAALPDNAEDRADLRFDEPTAQLWLRGLNDLRLSLGTSIGIGPDWEDQLAAMSEDDPGWFAVAVYDRLTAIQSSLIDALDRG